MPYNKESGYGRGIIDNFPAISPNGRVFVVGAATLDNVRIAQEIYKPDTDGVLRFFNTLAAAVAAVFQATALSVTPSTSTNLFTTTTAHGLNVGDKVYLAGTTAPTNYTLGVVYYVIASGFTTTAFKLSLQRGGSVIAVGSAGTTVSMVPLTSVEDTIYVLPSHNESISSATALNINTAGVNIVGLGQDEGRPTFYLDTGISTTVTISAPAVSIRNCIFDGTGFDAITTMFTVSASDFWLIGCKITTGNATNQAAIVLTTNSVAHRMKIDSCYVVGTTDAGTTNALQLVGGDDITITNNYFYGAYTTSLGPINNITTGCLRIRISNNILINATASSTKVIVLVAGTTGMINDNRLGILSGTAPITGAGTFVGSNYYAAAAGVTASALI